MVSDKPRRARADAQRNSDALIAAAREVFLTSGLDAPVREITGKAGVGLATFYRHFPERADLISAVFRSEVDACADTATDLAAAHPPLEALTLWLQRFTEFVSVKRGLAAALHSGNPTFGPLPGYFSQRFEPALGMLLDAAATSGDIRADIAPGQFLTAASRLCSSGDMTENFRLVTLLIDGLRFGAKP